MRQPFRRRHRIVLPYASPPVLFLEGPLCSSYVGFFGSMLLDSATSGGKAMVAYASHAARFFAPARGNLLVILRKWKAPVRQHRARRRQRQLRQIPSVLPLKQKLVPRSPTRLSARAGVNCVHTHARE